MKLNLKSKSLNNLGIILSLGFIFFCFVISIFSYLIIPDKSKFSNQMHLPIHSKEPGFKADFILVPNENSDKQSSIDKFFNGENYPNNEILISDFNQVPNGIEYSDYNSEKKFITKYP